jgi:hypothetical protein
MPRSWAPIANTDAKRPGYPARNASSEHGFMLSVLRERGVQAARYSIFFHPDNTHRCAMSGKKLSISSETRVITGSARR